MNNRHAFWLALIVAVLVFWTGILLGVMLEKNRANKLQQFYYESETNIFDILMQQDLLKGSKFCDLVIAENIVFADKIYSEAKNLEKYDNAAKITSELIMLHRRYDVLRVMLWNNIIQQEDCFKNKTNVIIYLYQYNNPSLEVKAKQSAMSKALLELKNKNGLSVILIPIASDTDVKSMKILKQKYNLTLTPMIFINSEHKITEVTSVEELEKYIQ